MSARISSLKSLLLPLLVLSASLAFAGDNGGRLAALETEASAGTASRQERLDLAREYVASGRYYEASQIAKSLLATNPEDTEAAALRDEAVAALREHQERSIADADAIVARGNLTDDDRLAVADAYFEGGRYISAADYYRVLPAAMQTRELKLRHARALAWSGQLDKSEQIFSQLLAESSDPALELEYGRVLSWMGAERAAVTRLAAIHASNPSEETAIALANARSWSGDREGALTLLTEYLAAHPDATEAATLKAEIESSAEIRVERLDRMIEVEPYNLALRFARARLLADAGSYAEALRTIEFMKQHSTSKIEGLAELEQSIREKRREQLAELKKQRKALGDTTPDDPEAIHSMAKSYVGLDEYDTAIELYGRYLAARPDDVETRIEYARVLGWDKRYSASADQYEILVEQNPDRADLRLEYAQILTYDDNYAPAMAMFRRLTDLSDHPRAHLYTDVPQQAHFNLGQIYRWYGWTQHAVMEQNEAIRIDGSYAPARRELDLVRHVKPATHYDATYTNSEDSSGFMMNRVDLEAEKWTSQRTSWNLLVGRHTFERGGDSVDANAFAVGGRYRWDDRWTARGRVGINNYSEGLGTRPYWGLGAEYLPSLQSRFALDYARYDLVYDVFTIESLRNDPIEIDDFRAHWDYKTGGRWAYLADTSYGFVSDDNNRLAAHGLLSFRVFKSPYVAVKADGRYLSYDFRSNRYWSPDDYRSIAAVLHVGDNFRQRFFWDAEVKYGRSYENDFKSDIRAYEARVTVPITDAFDIVGSYADGKSGRIETPFGGESFVNYWQRRWYVGVRVKRLFASADRDGRNNYYYDERRLDESTILPPLGERR